jgi:hypothetical protein
MYYLILIICIIIIFFWYFNSQENFQVVAFNASNIPCYSIESIYSKETIKLKEIFRQINTDLGVSEETETKQSEQVKSNQSGLFGLTTGGSPINYGGNFDSTDYTLINNNVSFAFDNQFKSIIKNILQKYFLNNLISITNITNIYFKQENGNMLYIFNCQFSNLTKFTSRNLIIKLKINNYVKFLNPTASSPNDFQSNIDSSLINTTILGITLNKNDDNTINYTTTYSPSVTLTPNLYTINNNLYLMDPFLTSGKEMIINDQMKTDFNKVIIDHSQTLNSIIQNTTLN